MKRAVKRFLSVIIIIIVLMVLILAALIIFRNPLATFVIEKTGSAIAGARVEVDSVYLKPLALHVSWGRLQVTDRNDTWKNLFETGKCEFSLLFKPLLAGKVLIEKMQLEQMQFDTARETDGKLPVKARIREKKPSRLLAIIKENLQKEKEKIPVFNPRFLKTKIDLDSLLQIVGFQTPARADSLKVVVENRYQYWTDLVEDRDYEVQLDYIKAEAARIDPQKMETLTEIEANVTAASNVYHSTIELYNDFKVVRENLSNDLQMMRDLKQDIPDWIKADYQQAVNLAKLPEVSLRNVALMLFGDRITTALIKVMDYIENARELAAKKPKPEKEKPEKMPELPSFWLQQLSVSGLTKNGINFSGKVLDISSDQEKTKKPMEIMLKGAQENTGRISLGAIFDYRKQEGQENINLMIDEVPIRDFDLANFDLLPRKLNKGKAMLTSNINITEDHIFAAIGFNATDLQFDYNSLPEMDANLVRISRTITEAITEINFNAEISQKPEVFKFKLNSNLDNIISQQLQNVVNNEVARVKVELENRVHQELDKYKTELSALIDARNDDLQRRFDEINARIDTEKQGIEAKQKVIENRIEEEKNKIKQQTEDKFKEEADKLLEKLKF
ncbi:MAG: TIGR03545 family protein [Candidatus Cloacimonetes bacterium]|nr:TIGR03545 family protein [Candidatus Cloacimonadota bacterium]